MDEALPLNKYSLGCCSWDQLPLASQHPRVLYLLWKNASLPLFWYGLIFFLSSRVFVHTLIEGSATQEPSSIEKVMEIDEHIGCAMSGLTADAKMLVDHARAETQVCRSGGRSQMWGALCFQVMTKYCFIVATPVLIQRANASGVSNTKSL